MDATGCTRGSSYLGRIVSDPVGTVENKVILIISADLPRSNSRPRGGRITVGQEVS